MQEHGAKYDITVMSPFDLFVLAIIMAIFRKSWNQLYSFFFFNIGVKCNIPVSHKL